MEVRTLLKFRIDGQSFAMLRDAQGFPLFNEAEQVIGVYRSVANGLAPKLASLLDFRLELPSKGDDSTIPVPAYLFAPFYIDQDMGWKDPWGSFARLKRSVRKDTLESPSEIRQAYTQDK